MCIFRKKNVYIEGEDNHFWDNISSEILLYKIIEFGIIKK